MCWAVYHIRTMFISKHLDEIILPLTISLCDSRLSVTATQQRAAATHYQRRRWRPQLLQMQNHVSMNKQINDSCKFSQLWVILGTSTLTWIFFSCLYWIVITSVSKLGGNLHIFVFSGPENVQNVEVIAQTETNITLKWEKVDNISTYMLQYDHSGSVKEENVTSSAGASITHEIAGLTAGTKYNFTIITLLDGATSTGFSVEAITSKHDWIYHFKVFLFAFLYVGYLI